MTVPPVPAPPTKASTLPLEGWLVVDGVLTTDSMISGPVVNSCANGLFTWAMTSIIELWWNYVDVEGSDVSVLVKYDCIRYFAL